MGITRFEKLLHEEEVFQYAVVFELNAPEEILNLRDALFLFK
jgi:hypothetical protein